MYQVVQPGVVSAIWSSSCASVKALLPTRLMRWMRVAGPSSMTLHEATKAAQTVSGHADEDAEIIFGAIIDDNLGEEMRVTVIAAGFDRKARTRTLGQTQHDSVEIPSFVQG